MKRAPVWALASACAVLTAPAWGGNPAPAALPTAAAPATLPAGKTVLVELFTSQGCDSCPEADAFVGEFGKLGLPPDRVVPITFHVGYWDDLGWKDPYAQDVFAQRQMTYAPILAATSDAVEGNIKGPYTPQMVIDGATHFSGARRDLAQTRIKTAAANAPKVSLSGKAAFEGTGAARAVKVSVAGKALPGANFDTGAAKIGMFAVLVEKETSTKVEAGENKGKTLREFQVARALAGPVLFRSSKPVNEAEMKLQVPAGVKDKNLAVVVFVQELATMKVLAALNVVVGG